MSEGFLLGLSMLILGTSFLSGILGMAGGMILMGVLLVFLPVPSAMVLHAVTQSSSNGWRAALWVRYVNWTILGRYLIGLSVAFAFFSFAQVVLDRAHILLLLGGVPLAGMLLPDEHVPRADRPGGAEFCGLVCSGLQLLSGGSGPILDLFFVRTNMDRRAVVATKATCQVFTHISRLVYFGGLAGTGDHDLTYVVLGVSVTMAIIGTSLSRIVLERMTNVQFRLWTQYVLTAVASVYVIQGLYALTQ
jgi:uncharacterized membrane protein YfcA